jgi:serine/threonine protein kinase
MAAPPRTETASDLPPKAALQDEHAKPAESPFHEGDVLLGKYRVEHVLGQGGMGVVVSVRHLELDELFAMKLMLPQAVVSTRGIGRFLREARAAARLKSEHVAKVFDVGRLKEDTPYIVMEYLHGSDLKALLQARGPLPVDEAVLYAEQVCEALAEAHGQGIIHRDLKPSNLFLIQRPNGKACVKVIDFGISKMAAKDGADLTNSGAVVGSPLYMSPEQMMQSKDVDVRSDVWAMGVVLYELVTGRVPFEGEMFTQIVGRVLNHEPLPPSGVRPELPQWLDAIVMRCLRKKPEERFQSIGELSAALQARTAAAAGAMTDPAFVDTVRALSGPSPSSAGEGASTTLAQSTWGQTSGRLSRPRRQARTGTFIGLLAAAAALVLGVIWLAQPSSPEPHAEPATVDTTAPSSAAPSLPPFESAGVPAAAPPLPAADAPISTDQADATAIPPSAPVKPAAAGRARSHKPPPKPPAAPPASTAAPVPAPPAPSTPPPREGVF